MSTDDQDPDTSEHETPEPIAGYESDKQSDRQASPTSAVAKSPTLGAAVKVATQQQDLSPLQSHRALLQRGYQKEASIVQLAELKNKNEHLTRLHDNLLQECKKKNESYVRREVQLKAEISRLKKSLETTVLGKAGDEVSMPALRKMHKQILDNVDEMQGRKDNLVQEHEHNLLRHFRSKLYEMEEAIKKQDDDADAEDAPKALLEKVAAMAREVDKFKEQAIRLRRVNEMRKRTVTNFQEQRKCQEDEREFLVRQMVALKKENERLQDDIDALNKERDKTIPRAQGRTSRPASGTGKVLQLREAIRMSGNESTEVPTARSDATNGKNTELVARFRKVLETERRNVKETQKAQMNLLAQTSELETILRSCYDKLKSEKGMDLSSLPFSQPSNLLTRADREKILESLLVQERVISLLYGEEPTSSVSQQEAEHEDTTGDE